MPLFDPAIFDHAIFDCGLVTPSGIGLTRTRLKLLIQRARRRAKLYALIKDYLELKTA